MSPRRRNELIVGRLQKHGAAPYQFRPGADDSYFVRLLTQRGERVLWGKDLERAIATAQSGPRVGDVVGARRISRESVTVTTRRRDQQGRVIAQNEQAAHRYRWVVEKAAFFADRAKLARRVRDSQVDAREEVRNHPELLSTFLTLRGAEEVARRNYSDPRDRERFLALVRESMAASIKQGEPLPNVNLRERHAPTAEPTKPTAPSRSDDDKTR